MVDSETLELLLKAQKCQTEAWQAVITIARQYQQMKLHGSYVERSIDGPYVISVCGSEVERYTVMFHENMLRAIERAFLEDALVGQALTKD